MENLAVTKEGHMLRMGEWVETPIKRDEDDVHLRRHLEDFVPELRGIDVKPKQRVIMPLIITKLVWI